MERNIEELRKILYKLTPTRKKLADELAMKLKHCLGDNIEVTDISFKENYLKLGELSVKKIETDPQILGNVLIHWFPNYNISAQKDPYCSVYALTEKEIRKIIKKLFG